MAEGWRRLMRRLIFLIVEGGLEGRMPFEVAVEEVVVGWEKEP